MSRILPYASGWYLLSLLLFSCALMSKTMVVSLPLLFLLLDWWPLHRLQRSTLKYLVVEKLPFLVLSAVAGLLTVHAERGVGAVATATLVPLQFRIANAILSAWGYLLQMLWPENLAVFYPYPATFSAWSVAGAALLLALISAFALRGPRPSSEGRKSRSRASRCSDRRAHDRQPESAR